MTVLPLRTVGLALLVAAPALWFGTGLLSPYPTSAYALGDEIRAHGSVDASDVRLAAWGGVGHSYDEANDTTLLFVAWCSHSLCGPLVRVEGDMRGQHTGPWLLVPRGDTLSFVDAGEFEERNETRAYALGVRDEGPAIDAVFDIRSPVPPFLGRLAALVALGAGIALAARPTWLALAPAALAALAGTTPATLHPSYVILVQIGGFLGVVGAAIAGIAVGLAKRRIPWGPMGVALAAALTIAIGLVALMHFDASGAGD